MRQRILNVTIIDGSGNDPFAGAVEIEDGEIQKVFRQGSPGGDGADVVIDGQGKTLMPGLCDAHLHLSWNDQKTLEEISYMPVEEHTLFCAQSAKTLIDAGFTSGVGAAAAKPRLDVVTRNAIAAGQMPGPRYLAASQEIATRGGLGDTAPVHVETQDLSFGWVVSGADDILNAVRMFIKIGVDVLKLNLSGEYIANVDAEETVISEAELEAASGEVHRRHRVMAAHARSAESVKYCVKYGVKHIYHASFADEEAIDQIAARKDDFFVAPGLAWLIQTARGASEYGILPDSPLAQLYERELKFAIEGMKEMRSRGIRILPGGDYGFAWTPHGTNAKDLEYFVDMIGMSPMDAIVSATKLGGEMMQQPDKLGLVSEGYFADLIVVDGDPLEDITVLQDAANLNLIMQGGRHHKNDLV